MNLTEEIIFFLETFRALIITTILMGIGALLVRLLIGLLHWWQMRQYKQSITNSPDIDDDDTYTYRPRRTLRGQIGGKGRHKARPIQRKTKGGDS